jgi:hypothetical protein
MQFAQLCTPQLISFDTIFVIYLFLFCQAELATLVGGSGNRKPPARKKPEVDLDAMVSV